MHKNVMFGYILRKLMTIISQPMTALPTVELDPPIISMTFGVNDSPLASRDGTPISLIIPSIFGNFSFDH